MDTVVSLDTLGGGAAMERFQIELDRVLENIYDANTKPDAVREVTLKLKIKPGHDRKTGVVQLYTSSKLSPYMPAESNVWFGKKQDTGMPVMVESNPMQLGLEITPAASPEAQTK